MGKRPAPRRARTYGELASRRRTYAELMEDDGKRGLRKLPANADDDDFGDRIRRLRLELCMSIHAFARAFGFSSNTVLAWEHGQRPQGASLKRLAEKTGKALDYFTGPLARSSVVYTVTLILVALETLSVASTLTGRCPLHLHHLCPL